PIGKGTSISDQIADVLRIVDGSGMPYKINPMGTVVEGDLDKVLNLIKECHETVMKNSDRALTVITIDDRKDRENRIELKVESVEKKLGRQLKK
ncbi:MAG: MTH1187 family thiamine-binding protein, partial [Candidatus Brocadiales bacterium]